MSQFDSIQRIKDLCMERNWSLYQLSRNAGISYSTLNTVMHHKNMPTLVTIEKLCQGFAISVSEFFNETDNTDPDLKEFSSRFKNLNAEKKQMVMAYIDSIE